MAVVVAVAVSAGNAREYDESEEAEAACEGMTLLNDECGSSRFPVRLTRSRSLS